MGKPETDGEGVFLIDAAMKAQQWERAKGELRALIALQGSYSFGRDIGDRREERWVTLEKRVNAFVQDVEDNGLQE